GDGEDDLGAAVGALETRGGAQRDGGAGFGELHRVADQVGQHLGEPVGVGEDDPVDRADHQLDVRGAGEAAELGEAGGDQVRGAVLGEVDDEVARGEPLDVDDVVDQPAESLGALLGGGG